MWPLPPTFKPVINEASTQQHMCPYPLLDANLVKYSHRGV